MKNIFIAMTFIGAGLLSLDASAAGGGGGQTFLRGFTLRNTQVCDSSNGVKQTYNLGFDAPGYFNVDDYIGSTIRYQQATFMNFGYPIANNLEKLTIHYANGSGFTRVMDLISRISGTVLIPNMEFPDTGGWDSWVDKTVWADIAQPNVAQKLSLVSVIPEGGPDVNWIRVDFETYACPPRSSCGYGWGTGGTVSCN